MGFLKIRTATDEDHKRLNGAAERFCDRHKLYRADGTALDDVECEIGTANPERAAYIKKLWRECARRALRCSNSDEIAYGSIGYSVD